MLKRPKILNFSFRWCCVLSWLCLVAQGLWAQDVRKLPAPLSTDQYDEIGIVASKDGQELWFTRVGSPDFVRVLWQEQRNVLDGMSTDAIERRLASVYSAIAGYSVSNPIQSEFNQDIFLARPAEDTYRIIHPGYPANNALPNSVVGIDEKSPGLFLLNQFYKDGHMLEGISRMKMTSPSSPSFPTPIYVKDLKNKGEDISVFVSPDGEVAIFALRSNASKTDTDLYISFFSGREDLWTAPKSLGATVNTSYRESTPYLSRDKRRLYFASDRPGGNGGTDLYVCERLNYSYDAWTTPEPLPACINTEANESHPCEVRLTEEIYFCSDRDGTYDIFTYKKTEPKLIREITIHGRIINAETNKMIGADLYYGPESLVDYLEYYSTFNGRFRCTVTNEEPLKFFPKKARFQERVYTFDFDSLVFAGVTDFNMDLYIHPISKEVVASNLAPADERIFNLTLDEIKERKSIDLHNIQFVRSKAIVLQSARPYLAELLRLMQKFPKLRIRISGHTDSQGPREALMKLSRERAAAVKEWLVLRGIATSRIETIGFGPTKPLNSNETERDRSLNRRVEITFLNEFE